LRRQIGRFYFHLQDGDRVLQDPEGTDLPDVEAARQEAILAARELLIDAIKAGMKKVPKALLIADEEGRTLDVLPLASVLPDSL
jgi:hypothetical protein